jgi:hypothetical protein
VLAILVLALTLATQVFAAMCRQHPALGQPAVTFGALKFYAPWQGAQWVWWWHRSAPHLFLGADVAFGVTTLGLLATWWWLAQQPKARPRAQATMATTAQLWWAGLLRRRGVVVGRRP